MCRTLEIEFFLSLLLAVIALPMSVSATSKIIELDNPKAFHCTFEQGQFSVFEDGKFESEPGANRISVFLAC